MNLRKKIESPTVYNILWQVGGSVVNRASFFITLLLISGYMLTSDYGAFGLSYNIALSISSVISTGLGITARRELVKEVYRKEQFGILSVNLIVILCLSFFTSLGVSFYVVFQNIIEINIVVFFTSILWLSSNASISYYLNYHYAGLGLFADYNKILLPINILLPVLCLVFKPTILFISSLIIGGVLLIGNIAQILKLHDKTPRNLQFLKNHYRHYVPCFLQAILGLPVLTILQTIIVSRWHDFVLVGLITIMQQFLNMSNIFATKTLTVFSPKITRLMLNNGYVPMKQLVKMFTFYMLIIIVITGAIIVLLPILLQLFKSNFLDFVQDMRYFLLLNILISATWFVTEYYHSIQKSWISFNLNIGFSVLVFVLFIVLYSDLKSFDLKDYANCLALSRVIFIYPIIKLCIQFKKKY